MRRTPMDKLALVLVIIGALNWLLVGLFQYDLVANLFGGTGTWISRTIYTVIGLGGLYSIILLFRDAVPSRTMPDRT